MQTPIENLHGLGPAKAKILNEELNLKTIEDLLYLFPFRYIDRTMTEEKLVPGEIKTCILRVQSKYVTHNRRKSFLIVRAKTLDNINIDLMWFHGVRYLRDLFKKDDLLVASAKIDFYRNLRMLHPDFEILEDSDTENLIHHGRIIPIYHSTDQMKKNNLGTRGLRKLFFELFNTHDIDIKEILPAELVIKKRKLMPRKLALQAIHYPRSQEELEEAQKRLKYEELFAFNFLMHQKIMQKREKKRELRPVEWKKSEYCRELLERLPYKLTEEQLKAIVVILESAKNDYASANLLQGDVGSGKTIVSIIVALHYIENGIQVAMLAPTEILAHQHFLNLSNLIGFCYAHMIDFLSSSITQSSKKNKEKILSRIKSGESKFIIGTHSIFEDAVSYSKLGFVIIDEQHRFGVKQKEKLLKKGKNPDLVSMTATPIPRTLCLTDFSDLNLVLIKEKPKGRLAIKSFHFTSEDRPRIYNSIRKYLNKGQQCYIVYPLIEESEKLKLEAATVAYKELRSKYFKGYRLALLHGQMKYDEKEKIMANFVSGKTQVLVSTTVIEVGVDVKLATVMVIENADRFGIAQLHQLRGRVGRDDLQSYCVFVSDLPSPESKARIEALVSSEDGFYLSEVDLQTRGSGEVLGLRQHGFSGLRLVHLVNDKEIIEEVYQDAIANPIPKPIPEALYTFISKRFPHSSETILPN